MSFFKLLDEAHEALGVESCDKQHLRRPTKPPFSCLPCRWPSLESCSKKATTSRYGTKCLPSNWQFEVGKWWWTSGCGVDEFWGQRICGSHSRLWGLSCQGPTPLWSVSSTQLSWAPLSIILFSKWWIKKVPLNWGYPSFCSIGTWNHSFYPIICIILGWTSPMSQCWVGPMHIFRILQPDLPTNW